MTTPDTVVIKEDKALDPIREMFDALVEADNDLRMTKKMSDAHDKGPVPQLKNAYETLEECRADWQAQEDWRKRKDELFQRHTDARFRRYNITCDLCRDLPYDIWFHHKGLAIALIAGDEDTPPRALIIDWQRLLPDLRNEEELAAFLKYYPKD